MVVYIQLSKQNEAEKICLIVCIKKIKIDMLANVGNEIFISQPSKRCINFPIVFMSCEIHLNRIENIQAVPM